VVAVSTVWRSRKVLNGAALIDEIIQLPTRQIELEFRIPAVMFEEMKPVVDKGEISVVSIHNYFPVPDILMPSEGSGDAFLLSSDDEEERALAVKYSKKTLEIASQIGAGYVVFHLGLVSTGYTKHSLQRSLIDEALSGAKNSSMLSRVKKLRAANRDRYFENCLRSIDEIIETAARLSVTMCLENRFYAVEIPNLEELGMIFEKYEGAPIKYWHDVGHGIIQERMGFDRGFDIINANAHRMAGVHLHDVKGFRDHLAPGMGEVDFRSLKTLLPENIIHVVEVRETTSVSEMVNAFELLYSLGY
jgi:sugar phosphate isomerase/epimerase